MQVAPTPNFPSRPFSRREALQLGFTDRQLRTAVAASVLRRPFRGVYIDAGVELTEQVRAAALALVVPKHAVVCDRTAAWLHGIDAFGYGDQDLVMPLELCSLRGHTRTRRAAVDGRVRDLADDDLMEIGAILVTTPLRTALDVGCGLTRLRALGALDAFRRKHAVSLADLHFGVRRFRGRRGVVQLRRLVPLSDTRAESPRESATRLLIHDAGLPDPELQWWINIHGVRTYRLDLAYPHLRIAIEYDGRDFHNQTTDQRDYDETRRGWLRANGWTVIVVDADSLFTNDNHGWLRELRRALRSRTKRLRWAREVA